MRQLMFRPQRQHNDHAGCDRAEQGLMQEVRRDRGRVEKDEQRYYRRPKQQIAKPVGEIIDHGKVPQWDDPAHGSSLPCFLNFRPLNGCLFDAFLCR
jgi:hypothetical protein